MWEPAINNEIYNTLGDRWYLAQDDPIALLRAEAKIKNPWIIQTILSNFPSGSCRILDIACGAGFLSNDLAKAGFEVHAIDCSSQSLEVARRWDRTCHVRYQKASAYHLPYPESHFDVACMLGFLEHVDSPNGALEEAERVLKPGGLLFFHTLNRNLLSWLVAIKGMEWFVKNTPPNLHLLRLFLKPSELGALLKSNGFTKVEMWGLRPKVNLAFFSLLKTGIVPLNFEFVRTNSLLLDYVGYAQL